MFRIGIVLSIAALSLLFGCKKDKGPQVCDHIRDLLAEALEYDVREENHARCLVELEKMKEADSERYRRVSNCILAARTLEGVSLCGF